jgi:hypothetical protein
MLINMTFKTRRPANTISQLIILGNRLDEFSITCYVIWMGYRSFDCGRIGFYLRILYEVDIGEFLTGFSFFCQALA